ncbi:serine/threonine-protein kinase pakB [Anopheles ziemanni]|uniref:serine/threonine-protein kinase pakB n=2 Tax=coustani group TaxID=59130 RepID=UPI00265ED046|nr:serine/threonine-protein kinase pakB [Anopheles ziemanni]
MRKLLPKPPHMAHLQRHRLESVSDHSGPTSSSSKSDSSDGSASEICEVMQEWSLDGSDAQSHPLQLHHLQQQQLQRQQQQQQQQHHHHHHHHHHLHHQHRTTQQQHHHSAAAAHLLATHEHLHVRPQHQHQQQQQQQHLAGLIPSPNSSYTQEDDVDEQDVDELEYSKHDLISLDNGVITDYERAQIESFFSGLGTEVYVSSSLANLYERVGKEDWRLVFTGIPVLLHDKGSTRSRCTPRVTFVLAERGTCFALWKDTIDNLSDYKVAAAAFHTMCLSADHRQVIGFSFDSNQAAREMWVRVEELTSNPENIALSAPGRKRKTPKRAKPIVLPPKSQISQPCQFNHVTSVTTGDTQRYFSLQAFVSAPVKHRSP